MGVTVKSAPSEHGPDLREAQGIGHEPGSSRIGDRGQSGQGGSAETSHHEQALGGQRLDDLDRPYPGMRRHRRRCFCGHTCLDVEVELSVEDIGELIDQPGHLELTAPFRSPLCISGQPAGDGEISFDLLGQTRSAQFDHHLPAIDEGGA
jgi:hypothetical protein